MKGVNSMLNLQQFIEKHNGTKLDYDDYAGNQCVDVTKAWLQNLGFKVEGAWGNAKDWDKNARTGLNWIANTPTGVPKPGDIVVWGGGSYGHVAIFVSGNSSKFVGFGQNWPSGKGEPCALSNHVYTGTLYVKGWLHPTVLDAPPAPDPKDALIADLTSQVNLLSEQVKTMQSSTETMQNTTQTMQKKIDELNSTIGDHEVEAVNLQGQITNLTGDKNALESKLGACMAKPAEVKEVIKEVKVEVPVEVIKEKIVYKEKELTIGELIGRIWEKIKGIYIR